MSLMACGKRPTHADLRFDRDLSLVLPCVESDLHRGAHVNEAGQTWVQHGSRGTDRPRGLGQSTRSIRQVSEPQQIDTDVVTGIMAERVWQNFDYRGFDAFECECLKIDESDSDRGPGFWCGREGSDPQAILDNWHPHHIEKRRNGPKANRHNVFRSRSRPENIAIVSPECHDRIERNAPEWSERVS